MSRDQDLVRRVLAGEDAAVEQITARVRRLVVGLAHARFGLDDDAAQELLQMCLTRLWEHDMRALRAWRGNGRLTTYVTVIVSRIWHRQRARRERRASLLAAVPEPAPMPPDTPADDLAADERRRQVRDALASLRPRDRLLVTWRFVEERAPREIAELMGLKPATARKAVHDAVGRLRRHLNEQAPELLGDDTAGQGAPGHGAPDERWPQGALNDP